MSRRLCIAAALPLVSLCLAVPAHAQGDPKFKIIAGAYATAAIADLSTSLMAQARGGHEVLFGAGLDNRPLVFGLLKGGMTASTLYLLGRMHRHRPRTAFWLGVALTSAELTAAAWNARQR